MAKRDYFLWSDDLVYSASWRWFSYIPTFFFPNQQLSKQFVLSFPNTPGFSEKISPDVDQWNGIASIFPWILPWSPPQVVAWAWWPLEHPWRCCHASAMIRFRGPPLRFRGGFLHGLKKHQSSVIMAKNTILNLNFMYSFCIKTIKIR